MRYHTDRAFKLVKLMLFLGNFNIRNCYIDSIAVHFNGHVLPAASSFRPGALSRTKFPALYARARADADEKVLDGISTEFTCKTPYRCKTDTHAQLSR